MTYISCCERGNRYSSLGAKPEDECTFWIKLSLVGSTMMGHFITVMQTEGSHVCAPLNVGFYSACLIASISVIAHSIILCKKTGCQDSPDNVFIRSICLGVGAIAFSSIIFGLFITRCKT